MPASAWWPTHGHERHHVKTIFGTFFGVRSRPRPDVFGQDLAGLARSNIFSRTKRNGEKISGGRGFMICNARADCGSPYKSRLSHASFTPVARPRTTPHTTPPQARDCLDERLAVVLELRRAAGVAEGDGEELRDTSGRDGLVLRPIAPGQRCQEADNAMRPAGSSAPLQPR